MSNMSTSEASDERLRSPTGNRRCSSSGEVSVKSATGRKKCDHQASCAKFTTDGIFKTRRKHRLATWNVRGLQAIGKLNILEQELTRSNIVIAGLSETHYRDTGHFTSTNGNFICFSGKSDESVSGVGFWVAKAHVRTVLGYKCVSDRIITIRINAIPTPINIIQVYAPTSNSSDEDIESFYNELESTLESISSREMVLIFGDFNSKVGHSEENEHLRAHIGKFGLGVRNERGQRLLQFCIDHNYSIANTLFEQHPRRLYTWTSPDGRYRNQIDYILVRTRWKSSISMCKTLPGSDCGSDHQLLLCELQLKLKICPRSKRIVSTEIVDPASFRSKCSQLFQNASITNITTTNNMWLSFKSALLKAAQTTQPKRNIKPKQPWISTYTLSVIEARKRLKMSGLDSVTKQNAYRQFTHEIQRLCRQDKNSYLQEQCREIQIHANTNLPKEMFLKIKCLTRDFKPKTWAVKNTDGHLITNLDDVIEVWRTYCENLYFEADIQAPSLNFEREPDILLSEVENAIKRLKTGKASGIDALSAEALKCLDDDGISILHTICKRVWSSGVWPDEWCTSIFVPLHKKGSPTNPDNYRLLSLISHSSKVLLYIIQSRLESFIGWQISPMQAGFVKGRGAREQILNLRQIIEKAREHYFPVYICFVDYSKAFDNILWPRLWEILLSMGVPYHLVFLIRQLYETNSARIRIDGSMSDQLVTRKGVRQGCVLSPILFNIYSEFVMRQVLDNWDGGITIGGNKISNLRFADDTTLIAATQDELLSLLNVLEQHSAAHGLSINYNKTKVMIIDREHDNHPEIKSVGHCQTVQSFIYLGSLIDNSGGCENEIRRRIQQARVAMTKLSKIWRDKNITKITKMSLVQSLVFSIFLYASETWTVKKTDRAHIDAFEMWVWRRMLRVPYTAHRTNISIFDELGQPKRLSSIVLTRVLTFFGHIHRNDNMEKLIVQGHAPCGRRRGRSPTRWVDATKQLLDVSVTEATKLTVNRERWRTTIYKTIDNLRASNAPAQT